MQTKQAAVGTTIALLERGSRVMSAIHKRCYAAMKEEFKFYLKLYHNICHQNIHTMLLVDKEILNKQTLIDRVDVIPVADPNIFSMSQRITLAQTQLQISNIKSTAT